MEDGVPDHTFSLLENFHPKVQLRNRQRINFRIFPLIPQGIALHLASVMNCKAFTSIEIKRLQPV
jgi:hypothetical protein